MGSPIFVAPTASAWCATKYLLFQGLGNKISSLSTANTISHMSSELNGALQNNRNDSTMLAQYIASLFQQTQNAADQQGQNAGNIANALQPASGGNPGQPGSPSSPGQGKKKNGNNQDEDEVYKFISDADHQGHTLRENPQYTESDITYIPTQTLNVPVEVSAMPTVTLDSHAITADINPQQVLASYGHADHVDSHFVSAFTAAAGADTVSHEGYMSDGLAASTPRGDMGLTIRDFLDYHQNGTSDNIYDPTANMCAWANQHHLEHY